MATIKLDTGFNIEVEFATAPLFRRFMAWMVDLLVIWLLTKAVATLLDTASIFIWTDEGSVKGVIAALPMIFYHLVCEIAMNGQSPGKMVMQCRVVTEEGGEPTLSQYFTRWVFRPIDFPYWILPVVFKNMLAWWTFPLLFAGFVSMLRSQRSQRIGDIVAGTILIDLRNRTSWEDTVFTNISLDYKPRYPKVMELTDRDVNALKSIIETVKRRGDHRLARKIAERIKDKLKIDYKEEPAEFLEILLMDYNYYTSR
jgi:uncharacterized RDD family membrane protein YckC